MSVLNLRESHTQVNFVTPLTVHFHINKVEHRDLRWLMMTFDPTTTSSRLAATPTSEPESWHNQKVCNFVTVFWCGLTTVEQYWSETVHSNFHPVTINDVKRDQKRFLLFCSRIVSYFAYQFTYLTTASHSFVYFEQLSFVSFYSRLWFFVLLQ